MTTYLLLDGTEVTKNPESNYQYKILGKVVKTETQQRFYIATHYGSLIDNRTVSISSLQRENVIPSFKQVSSDFYEKYRRYCQNGQSNITIASLERLL